MDRAKGPEHIESYRGVIMEKGIDHDKKGSDQDESGQVVSLKSDDVSPSDGPVNLLLSRSSLITHHFIAQDSKAMLEGRTPVEKDGESDLEATRPGVSNSAGLIRF